MITQFDITTGDVIESDHEQPARHPQGAERRAALRLMTVAEATEIEGVRTALSPDAAKRRVVHWLAA
ncbi:MAG: hypothetical protein WBM65_01170 [Sedimenticolaceae bacterium]